MIAVRAFKADPALLSEFDSEEIVSVAMRSRYELEVRRSQSGRARAYVAKDLALKRITVTFCLRYSDTIGKLLAILSHVEAGESLWLWPSYDALPEERYDCVLSDLSRVTAFYYAGRQSAMKSFAVEFLTKPVAYIMVGRHRIVRES